MHTAARTWHKSRQLYLASTLLSTPFTSWNKCCMQRVLSSPLQPSPAFTTFHLCLHHHVDNTKSYPMHNTTLKALPLRDRQFLGWWMKTCLGQVAAAPRFR
jgi:hypothetical protein